jgi:hypothetical protein
MPTPTNPLFRYELRVELPPTEIAVLVDALDGDELTFRERLGTEELQRQLDEQELVIDVLSERSWPGFQREIEVLSTYLSEPISAREIHLQPGADAPLVEGWVILASRGQSERLALEMGWDPEARAPVDGGIDIEKARRRWKELPEWVRSSLTNKHPELGRRIAAA